MTAINPSLEAAVPGGLPAQAGVQDWALLAHDIRTHLQGVVGGVAALEAVQLPPDAAEQVGRVAAAAASLADLIGVAVEGVTAGGAGRDGEEAALDLGEFLDHFRSRWTVQARERGLTLALSRAADLPRGLAVPWLTLSRMLDNLAANAIGHSGGGTVEVTFVRAPGGGVLVRVSDEGPGIPAAVVDRLFGRAGSSPPDASHGLGLAIVRDLSRAAGCDFSLGNRSRGGADATLCFPASLCLEDEPAAVSADAAAAVPRGALRGLRVLLAEDNPTNQLVATQMLRALEVEVTIAADGVEALERFEAETFDVLLVDIEMPRLSGLDVIRRIRARTDRRASVPIIALTAYALREHRDRIAEAGADGLISKPITSVEVLGRGLAPHVPAPLTRAAAAPPPEAAPAGDAPVIDRGVFDALAAAIGEDMIAELLDKVVADLVAAREELARGRSPLDRGRIRAAAHILISVAGAVGALRLQGCARLIHATAEETPGPALIPEVDRCIDEIDAAIGFAGEQRAAV